MHDRARRFSNSGPVQYRRPRSRSSVQHQMSVQARKVDSFPSRQRWLPGLGCTHQSRMASRSRLPSLPTWTTSAMPICRDCRAMAGRCVENCGRKLKPLGIDWPRSQEITRHSQSEMTAPLCLQTCGLPQPRSTCLHVGTVRGHHSTSSDWLGLFAAILGRASPGCS